MEALLDPPHYISIYAWCLGFIFWSIFLTLFIKSIVSNIVYKDPHITDTPEGQHLLDMYIDAQIRLEEAKASN